jgi:hypothetical protein
MPKEDNNNKAVITKGRSFLSSACSSSNFCILAIKEGEFIFSSDSAE